MEVVEAELARLEAELFAPAPPELLERRVAIGRLLATRNDHLPEPLRRTEASSGFVHGAPTRVTCEDCLANDAVMFGCETCGGRGYTEVKQARDPYATDKVVPYGFDGSRHEAVRARDRQIEILGNQLRPAPSEAELLEEANHHPYAWERARKRMYRLFDYGRLDRALDALRQADAEAHGALLAAGACSIDDGLRGLAFLSDHLPVELRVPEFSTAQSEVRVVGKVERAAGRRVRSLRDAEIRRAVLEAGIPTSNVASQWGISVSQVNRIVADAA